MRKSRPCIIVNDDSIGILPLRIIVPLTEWKERYSAAPWMVKIEKDLLNQLSKDSSADCFQIRSLSTSRFVAKIGNITPQQMIQIENALKIALKI